MNEEYDKLCADYWAARDAWNEAEKAFARASAALTIAERARRTGWDKLVKAAEILPDEARKRVAAAEFCGAPR